MARTNGATTPDVAVNGAAKRSTHSAHAPGGQPESRTNYSWWRLENIRGRQIWKYLESEEEREKWPQSVPDKYHLGLDTVSLFTSAEFHVNSSF